jgi:hypothetical protein
MESTKIIFDMDSFGKALPAFVRERAIRYGSFIVYEENGQLIKEDPRTGKKILLSSIKPS